MRKDLYNFKGLFSEIKSIFDSEFNNFHVDEKYNDVFNTLKAQYNTIIDDSFKSDCNKAIEYLKYLEQYYEGDINAAKGSIYLYCWLYDVEFYKSKYNNNRINIYKKLLDEYSQIEFAANVQGIFGNYLNGNIGENLKKLYDLYYKFDKFRKDQYCSGNKCKCAEECYTSYNDYIKECNKSDNVDFCNGLEEFREQYNNYTSNGFKCNEDYKYLPSAINSDISVILIPTIATLIISSILFVLYKVIIIYIYVNITYFHEMLIIYKFHIILNSINNFFFKC
ncbi:hypothetical protein PVBG_06047 [Plasmodium vivax Brazil I]|uniref:Uncharacterized protein n=1 Tax=Plasmodium vivax (strain Brazil I) TaxID=1033975 RepID=A0A0J9SK55_PLAV1|nr:hypothetical protein PVBG_06047 [Plasmodium vivax Brazil I]